MGIQKGSELLHHFGPLTQTELGMVFRGNVNDHKDELNMEMPTIDGDIV